jgi:L-lactate dehydrogenase complex protein LldG
LSAAREAVLGRLREAYGRNVEAQAVAEANVRERVGSTEPNLIPERGQRDLDGRVALFAEMAQAVMAEIRHVPDPAEVPAAVAAYLREHNLPQRIVMAPEPLLDRCPWRTQPLLRVRRGTAAKSDLIGVTLAVAGVAETGTLVLASSPERPTLLTQLPETSIVVLPRDRIDGAYEQAWDRIRALPGGVPRSVNFITGPSRTADIAQKLELGAHGPKRLLILIVDGLGAPLSPPSPS